MGNVVFRRIGSRIIPIRDGAGSGLKRRAASNVASGVAGVGAAVVAGRHLQSKSAPKTAGPDKRFLALGYGLQVLSGVVSGFPFKGKSGLALSVGTSIGADLLSTSALAKSVQNMKGSRKKKVLAYAKHQAIGTGIGYATFGASLLANPAVRSKLVSLGSKLIFRR